MVTEPTRTLTTEALRDLMEQLLAAVGCGADAADAVATVYLEAEIRGHKLQGLYRLPKMLRNLRDRRFNPNPRPRVVRERNASAIVDGDGGPGPPIGLFAADVAVRKAKEAGACAVGIRNSGDVFMVGYYGERIADAGLVAIVAEAAAPWVHPFGGAERLLSTNPLVVAVPTTGSRPFLLDAATSAMAHGSVVFAEGRGEQLPEGAALGPDGQTTRDPSLVLREGALSPLGGAKGYALSFFLSLLAGPLVGAAVGKTMLVPGFEGAVRSGDLMLAIDPAVFGDAEAFRRRVSGYLTEVTASRAQPGASAIRTPGERSFAERERTRRDDVAIDRFVWDEVTDIARELGVPIPA